MAHLGKKTKQSTYFKLFIFCSLCILFFSCEKKEEPPVIPGGGTPDIVTPFQMGNVPFQTINNSMDAEVLDLNKDGNLDLILAMEYVQNLVLLGNGEGGFVAIDTLFANLNFDSEDIAIGDFNADGNMDVVFVSEDNATNEYYQGQDDGSFKNVTDLFPVTGITNGIDASDVDADGDLDLFMGNNGLNFLLINDGLGNFTNEANSRIPTIFDSTQDVEFGDVDNDGDDDILLGNEDSNYLLINDGKGVFEFGSLPLKVGVIEETREADFADIDGDGYLDIVFANVNFFPPQQKDPANRILINDGNGQFTDETINRYVGENTYISLDVDFADLDDDGDLDMLIANAFGSPNQIFLNEGGIFTDETDQFISTTISGGVDVEVADFNNDGKPDIYFGVFDGFDHLLLSK
ncbi:MAG: VCBS repeat-containing protein [Bacteroidota bacterium]